VRVLVTGASGFIGSAVAAALASAGQDVVGLHRSQTPFLQTLASVDGVTLARRDLSDLRSIDGRFDAVVHAAATSPAPGVDSVRIVHDNVMGTAALIREAERWRCRALVFCSSLSIYGSISAAVVDEETHVVDPDAYGASKRLGELMLEDRAASLPALALRLPSVVGRGAHRNWVSGVAEKLLAGQPIPAYHLERPFNNAVHVRDICALVNRVLQSPWEGFDRVVLGARGGLAVRGVIERLAAGLGVDARVVERPPEKVSFTLCSDRAITRWGYDPLDIGSTLDAYAEDTLACRNFMRR